MSDIYEVNGRCGVCKFETLGFDELSFEKLGFDRP